VAEPAQVVRGGQARRPGADDQHALAAELVGDQLLDGQVFQLRAGQRSVHVVNVRLMVLRMMDFHRPRVDVRLQGVVGIGQRG